MSAGLLKLKLEGLASLEEDEDEDEDEDDDDDDDCGRVLRLLLRYSKLAGHDVATSTCIAYLLSTMHHRYTHALITMLHLALLYK